MNVKAISYKGITAIVTIPETPDHISDKWNQGVFYEAHESGMLPRIYELRDRYKDGLALDIGAHWGNHSMFFAEVIGMRVRAFEPRPESYHQLCKNTKSLHVDCHRMVLGASNFDRYKQIDGPKGNTGMTRFAKKPYTANTNPENKGVAGTSLDTVLPIMEPAPSQLRLIKIDVEGSEIDVIKGARLTIINHKPDLWIETENPLEILMLLNKGRTEQDFYKKEGPYNHTATWRFYI